MARTGTFVVVLLALTLLLVAPAASASPSCCTDNHSWGGGNSRTTGCSPDQNDSCNEWCSASCRGGECKLRGGKHVCHCYC